MQNLPNWNPCEEMAAAEETKEKARSSFINLILVVYAIIIPGLLMFREYLLS